MNKCMLCKSENCSGCARDLALLLLRLVLGVVFIYHGWAKITNIEATLGFFSSIGLGNVGLVYLAAYGEFIGGVLMILGLWVSYAAVLLSIISLTALLTVHISKGFGIMGGGYEYILTLLVLSISIGLMGAGKYSAMMHKEMSKPDMK